MRRALLIAGIAALGALPAAAFGEGASGGGDGGLPHAGALGLSASLDSCGIAETTVVCKINATFNEVPDAQYYTSSVTRPDGSVVDYGSVGGGSTSLWVPYAGDGDYTVQVSAYGKVKPDKPPKELAHDKTGTGDKKSNGEAGTGEPTATPGRGEVTAPDDGDATATPPPPCDDTTTPPPPPDPGTGSTGTTGSTGSSGASGATGLQAEAAAASDPAIPGVTPDQAAGLATQAEVPQAVTDTTDCPDTAQATDGRCCPQDAG